MSAAAEQGGKVDMSLDDIIAADRKSRGGRGGGGRGGSRSGGGGQRNGGGRGCRSRGAAGGRGGDSGRRNGFSPRRNDSQSFVASGPGKLLISNLDYQVSEADLYELFSEFGRIRVATIHYDRHGQSLGSGEVDFDRKSDAIKGLKRYNGVPLDGKPMKIEITANGKELFETIRRPQGGGVGGGRREGGNRQGGGRRGGGGGGRGGRGNRGSGGRGAGGGSKKENGPAPSKESLDEEMDAYMSSGKKE